MASKALVKVLTAPVVEIPSALNKFSVNMSEKTDPQEAMEAVNVVCTALTVHTEKLSRMRVLLGQMIRGVKRFELYKPAFKNFGDYMASLEKEFNLGPSTLKDAVTMMERWPELTPEKAENISVSNLKIASRAIVNAEPRQRAQIVRDAESMTEDAFRDKMQAKELIRPLGRPEGGSRNEGIVTLAITVSARVAQKFRMQARKHENSTTAKYLQYLMSLDGKPAS